MHILAYFLPPSPRLHARTMVGMKGTSTTISLVKEATAVPQQRCCASARASEGRLSSEAHVLHARRHIARNFCCLVHDQLRGIIRTRQKRRSVCRGGAALLLPRSPRRHPPTQKHPAPLQPHDPDWGDKDGDRQGDRTNGDVISHRPGADAEVEAAGEEPARRQRRRVAWQRGCPARGRGCRRGPLTCASRARCSPSRGPAVLWSLGRLPGSAASCVRGTTPFGDSATIM